MAHGTIGYILGVIQIMIWIQVSWILIMIQIREFINSLFTIVIQDILVRGLNSLSAS